MICEKCKGRGVVNKAVKPEPPGVVGSVGKVAMPSMTTQLAKCDDCNGKGYK